MKYSLKGYFEPTPKNINKVLFGLKSLIATIAGSAYFSGNEKAALWILVSGAVIDFLANFFSE